MKKQVYTTRSESFSLLFTIITLIVFLLILTECCSFMDSGARKYVTNPPEEYSYHDVHRVIDGDTIVVIKNGSEVTLRLIGINTPETVDPRKPVECFGTEATEYAKLLLHDNKVRIEGDTTQEKEDRYGRLLVYLYTEDNILVNKKMIEEGYAYEYTYDTAYQYQSQFKEAEVSAKKLKKGLWSPHSCNGDLLHNMKSGKELYEYEDFLFWLRVLESYLQELTESYI